jgi:D-alanyl-D-alanine carboxypeptidase
LPYFGHGGAAPGMNGQLRVYPEFGYVVVVLSNFGPPTADIIADFFTLRVPVDIDAAGDSSPTDNTVQEDNR